jgi:hypothetical protein
MDGGKEERKGKGSEKKAEAKREKGRAFQCFPSTGRTPDGVRRRFTEDSGLSLSLSLSLPPGGCFAAASLLALSLAALHQTPLLHAAPACFAADSRSPLMLSLSKFGLWDPRGNGLLTINL